MHYFGIATNYQLRHALIVAQVTECAKPQAPGLPEFRPLPSRQSISENYPARVRPLLASASRRESVRLSRLPRRRGSLAYVFRTGIAASAPCLDVVAWR